MTRNEILKSIQSEDIRFSKEEELHNDVKRRLLKDLHEHDLKNSKYKIGDKVIFFYGIFEKQEHEGIIADILLGSFNNPNYKISRVKKDGTASKVGFWEGDGVDEDNIKSKVKG